VVGIADMILTQERFTPNDTHVVLSNPTRLVSELMNPSNQWWFEQGLKTSTVSELRCPRQALINFHDVVYTVPKEKK
jgi:hypothetical protein